MEAIKQSGFTFELSYERFEEYLEFIWKKKMKNGCALQFASERLRDDKDFVLEAVK